MQKFLLTLSLLLFSVTSYADKYIYPVATGTSWCRDVFVEVESAQQEFNQNNPAPAGIPDFANLFSEYYDYWQQFQLYEDSIFMDASQEEWIDMFERRSLRYSDLYPKTNALLKSIQVYFSGSDIPDAAYDSLYYWTRNMYHKNMSDLFVIEQLVDSILTPHYEKDNDYEHLELCYSYSGLAQYQFSRMGETEAAVRSFEKFQKAVELRTHFADFKDPLNRYYLISSFVNLCVLHTQSGNVSLKDAIAIHGQMWELFLHPEVKKLLEEDQKLDEMAGWSLRLFCFRSIMTYISQGLNDPEMLEWLYWAYGEAKNNLGGTVTNLKHRYYAKIEYDEPIIEATMGHISWDEAYMQFVKMLRTDPELATPKNMKVYRMNYMNNLFVSHIYLIEKSSMDFREKSMEMKDMLGYVFDVIKHFEHIQFPFEKGEIINNLATHPDLLKYMSTDEKRYMLYKLLVLEQPSSCVHVTMVADIADMLTSALVDERPDYFGHVPHLSDPDSVSIYKKELIDFVRHSALFHEVGKISMPTIVNNRYRSLTDHELSILRMHPEKSEPYFAIDPAFKKYGIIAQGHHKWYNGQGGYPESFDNTNRLLFPFMNIVSICDYMDESLDEERVDKRKPKDFEDVMKELKAGAGTQFDPVLVKFIRKNPGLYRKLKEKVYTSRARHYYIMYRIFIDEGDYFSR